MSANVHTFQAKNPDNFMVGVVKDGTSGYYSPLADRLMVEGAQSVSATLETDSAENKTEGYITALYGRVFKGTVNIKGGKIPLQGYAKMLGQVYSSTSNSAILRIRRTAQLPNLFFDFQSLWDENNEGAEKRLVVFKSMVQGTINLIQLDQDNMATFDLTATCIFPCNLTDRSDDESFDMVAIMNQPAVVTLGDLIPDAAVS